jgi:CheY-like chemotaxis protein
LKKRNLKVIAQTAYDIKGQEERYIAAGWHVYIAMPLLVRQNSLMSLEGF